MGSRQQSRQGLHGSEHPDEAGHRQPLCRHGGAAWHVAGRTHAGHGVYDLAPPTSTITSPANGATFAAGAPVTITGTAAESGGGIVAGVEVSTNGGTTWTPATGTTSWSYSWVVSGTGSVTIRSRAYDDSGNMETPSAGRTINITPPGTCPCSIWSAAAVPPAPVDDGDASSVEIGTKSRADSNGFITGVRFYKAPANTGTHTGTLWSNTGTQLATVTFSGETASGWQQASFPNPVAITANTSYVVSYHAPVGHYTGTDAMFAAAVDNPPLHALRDGVDGANGLYAYGTGTAFPTNTWNSENYWVDVVFTTTAPPDSTPPTVTSTFPAASAINVDPATPVSATFSEAMNASTISSSTFELRNPSNVLVPANITYNATSRIATLQPLSSLALSTTYTALVKGGAADPRVKDVAGNALAANASWTFTTAAVPPPPVSCPCSIWAPTVVPLPIDDGDPTPTVLGTKFRSDIAGYVTGARFYKAPLNTGTHVATLWSGSGTALATATFAGESASGWQQVMFPTPVAIAANTSYVISYLAPNGHYSGQDGYFASAGIDNPPLHALRNGVDGPNGLYRYSSSMVFPTDTYQSEGYFPDVVFNTTIGPDVTAPAVKSVNPTAGASGVLTTTNVVVTFTENVDQTTITTGNVFLRTPTNTVVPATVSYSAATNTATIDPSSSLAFSTLYTGVVKAAVRDVAGNAMTADFTWTFTSSAPPPPPPTQGPGGPVLVVTTAANPFSVYHAEILRGEGLNAFATADLSAVTGTTLNAYDVVILGETPLTAPQVSMFTSWVNAGGNLIAMRPDKQLATLLGLTDALSTLSNAYLLVDTATAPGAGIVNQTMQFHGVADRYTLNGATAIATLYSNATTATLNPAATTRTVGSGRAVAFTYDLAKSVVYTRQGNPAWSGQERDGSVPIRSDDLFFGARAGDVQPDWVDLNKVAIPQADEQQRLLWNIVLNMNASKKPLPRFWYFPRMLPAVVIMTGDDHANNATAGRFNGYASFSAPGCSVADWQCIRGTSYIYPGTPITNSEVQSYVAQGFEIALHLNTNCVDWTAGTLPGFYSTQLAQFATQYPSAGAPKTNRTHCIANSDYATQWQVELNNGIRLDTTYYYFPSTWILDRPGMFTGSGMPQRFTTATGQMIDVYQATTQMTDESGQTFPKNPNTLLDNAINLGYYGAFTANMHTDVNGGNSETWSTAIVNSAVARNVPVITARQMLDWLDGRNGSSFQSITWGSNILSFTIAVGAGANGLRALVPAAAASGAITGITLNGAFVPFTTQTIKGVSYAVFAAGAGAYQVAYGADIVPPTISAVSVAPGRTTATVTWTTDEPSTSTVSYGTSAASLTSSFGNSVLVTAHNLTLPSLAPGTQYFYRVTSADAATPTPNSSTSPPTASAPATFTTTASVVSGTITPAAIGSGSTVTLTGGAAPVTVTADAFGNYQFSNVLNGTFTVTPAKTSYTFTPANRTISVAGLDVTVPDFAAQPVTITGTVTPPASGSGTTLALTGTASATVTANGSGAYSFGPLVNGSYTVTPTKTGFVFTPSSRTVTINGASLVADFAADPVPTYNVTGTVSPAASGSGATLTLSGAASQIVTADAAGNYSFTGLANGSYTVTPSKTGFTFTPANQPVNVNNANPPAVNFAAQPVTISGAITPPAGGAGSTVTLAGPATGTVTADAAGAFTFSALPNGTYTVTPTKSGVTFTPANRSVVITNGVSVGGVNFTANLTYSLAGTITPGASGSGATLTLTGGATATANGSGNYTFTGVANGTYTVTPTKAGFTFSPTNRIVTINDANATVPDFTAAAIPTFSVSGTVSPAASGSGTTLTLTGGATATADGSGNFTFTGVVNGTYTVTPTKTGFTFTPVNRSVTVSGGNVTAVNFTAAASSTLSIDVVNTVGQSTRSTSLVSGAFSTTAGNELLLALISTDNGNNESSTTVTTVTGGGLTWTLVRRTNAALGDSEIWRAFAPAVLTGTTVTATFSQSVAAAITVISFRGVDTTGTNGSGAIGATGSANALTGAPSASLVTTRNNSYVVGVGNDWDGAIARTVGPGQTLVSQFLAAFGDTFWVQRTTNPVAAAGTTVTINDTAPTDHRYNLTIVEILPQ